ncbi:unnamed protein product [Boreogadus saida]
MTSGVPRGCGAGVKPLYFNLCDLDAAWGVAVEAVAAAGALTSVVLLVFLVGVRPLVGDRQRRRTLPLLAAFTLCTLGLFGLALAFVAGRDFVTCAARRFVFGVLFAGCLACLATHGLWLALLGGGGGSAGSARGPRGWLLGLGGLALWLVEVMVNTEWLILTLLRSPLSPPAAGPDLSCSVANQDFVAALVYVMALLLAAVATAVGALTRKDGGGRWRRDGAALLSAALLTAALWAAWVGMYVYGNRALGRGDWDDPTVAVALVANGWAFLLLYVVPEAVWLLDAGGRGRGARDEEEEEDEDEDAERAVYPARGALDYGRDRTAAAAAAAVHNLYMDNAAFCVDEPKGEEPVPEAPPTPQGPRPGPLRRGVYQPTEMALIHKGLTYTDFHKNAGTMASAPAINKETPSPTIAWPLPPPSVLRHADSGNALNRKPLW